MKPPPSRGVRGPPGPVTRKRWAELCTDDGVGIDRDIEDMLRKLQDRLGVARGAALDELLLALSPRGDGSRSTARSLEHAALRQRVNASAAARRRARVALGSPVERAAALPLQTGRP